MTAHELQNIALRLSNWGWCRHWLHWNYPQREPWLMAVQVCDSKRNSRNLVPVEVADIEKRYGFRAVREHEQSILYTIERTDENGSPYWSPL